MDLNDAMERACRFLLARRDRDGWWRDFDFQGRSDEWVTAYTAVALHETRLPQCLDAAASAWDVLRSSRWWRAGWGFSRFIPCDADSTAYALLLAARLGARGSRVHRAYALLRRHIGDGGGVATYVDRGALRVYTRVVGQEPTGWCSPHPCVSAAVACLRSFAEHRRVAMFLRNVQRSDGTVPAYWWCDSEYATALACEALRDDREFADRAGRWAITRAAVLTPDDSPFAVACTLRILLSGAKGNGRAIARTIDCLRAQQLPDGSWPSSARLRLVMPNETNPDAPGAAIARVAVDPERIFTTATATSALARARLGGDA